MKLNQISISFQKYPQMSSHPYIQYNIQYLVAKIRRNCVNNTLAFLRLPAHPPICNIYMQESLFLSSFSSVTTQLKACFYTSLESFKSSFHLEVEG